MSLQDKMGEEATQRRARMTAGAAQVFNKILSGTGGLQRALVQCCPALAVIAENTRANNTRVLGCQASGAFRATRHRAVFAILRSAADYLNTCGRAEQADRILGMVFNREDAGRWLLSIDSTRSKEVGELFRTWLLDDTRPPEEIGRFFGELLTECWEAACQPI